jgi:recombination protein RecA
MNPDRLKSLDLAITQIERQFGKGTVMRLGEATKLNVDAIPTGSLALDIALGVGGVPRGRIIEIYGPESSGKTTVSAHIVAEAQRMGGVAAFIDAEHAVDPVYMANLGVDVANLLISQPDTGEEALEIMDALIRSNAIDVVVLDSVAALVPKSEMEGDMGDSHVGLQARLMSQALRKLGGTISKSNTVAIFINQIREKIGVMFGNPETTPGGRALKFWSSVRLEVRRGEAIKTGADAIGSRTKVKIVKNKVAPPFRTAEFDLMFKGGISKEGGILDVGVEQGVINKAGAFFSYKEQRLGQGRENAKNFLAEHTDIRDTIEQQIRQGLEEGKVQAPIAPPGSNGANGDDLLDEDEE